MVSVDASVFGLTLGLVVFIQTVGNFSSSAISGYSDCRGVLHIDQ